MMFLVLKPYNYSRLQSEFTKVDISKTSNETFEKIFSQLGIENLYVKL